MSREALARTGVEKKQQWRGAGASSIVERRLASWRERGASIVAERVESQSIRCPAVPGELGHILDHICVTSTNASNVAEMRRPVRESSQVDLQTGILS